MKGVHRLNIYQVIIFICAIVFSISSCAEGTVNDPLPSWNAGPIKENIIHFVESVSDKKNPDYISPEDRIATFDNDGTLWVEQPIYTQVLFMIDKMKAMAPKHPEWKLIEPYKSILSDQYQNLTGPAIDVLFAETSGGLSVEDYQKNVKQWLSAAQSPRYKHRYTEMVYQPMLEVMDYLRKHDFKVYIVSGGGQDFIRSFAGDTYGVHANEVVGTTTHTQFVNKNQSPLLMKQNNVLFVCDKEGKPEAIHLFIGKHPVIAFGNSDGDRQMLEWTQAANSKKLMLLVHHDDAAREYSYDSKSKVGTFSESLKKEAKDNHWQVISMKNDWKVMFPFELKK